MQCCKMGFLYHLKYGHHEKKSNSVLARTDSAEGLSSMQYRTQTSYHLEYPPVTPSVARLLLIFGTAFFVETIAYLAGTASMGLHVLEAGPGFHPVQIITHIFISGAPAGFLGTILKLLMLWIFGSELERLWGSYNFLKFFLLNLVGGTFLFLFVASFLLPGEAILGFDAGLMGIFVAYGIIWPERQILFWGIFPIRMKWLMAIIGAGMIFFALTSGRLGTVLQESGGGLTAALFIFYYARQGRMQSGYILASGSGNKEFFGWFLDPIRERRRKKKLEKKQEEINRRIDLKNEVDRLLDKISKEGIQSLSKKEKKFLDEASREF